MSHTTTSTCAITIQQPAMQQDILLVWLFWPAWWRGPRRHERTKRACDDFHGWRSLRTSAARAPQTACEQVFSRGRRETSRPPQLLSPKACELFSYGLEAMCHQGRARRAGRRPWCRLRLERCRAAGGLNKITLGFGANVQERCILQGAWEAPTDHRPHPIWFWSLLKC